MDMTFLAILQMCQIGNLNAKRERWKNLRRLDNNFCDWLAKLVDLSPISSILLLWPGVYADGCFWGTVCGLK